MSSTCGESALASWRGTLEGMSIERLCDLHDKSYIRQDVLDNHLNNRARELVRLVKNAKEEVGVIRAREKSREVQYAELKSTCDEAMVDFEKNPLVVELRSKIQDLGSQLKDSYAEYGRLKVEGSKVVGFKERITTLDSKCSGLEAERIKLGE